MSRLLQHRRRALLRAGGLASVGLASSAGAAVLVMVPAAAAPSSEFQDPQPVTETGSTAEHGLRIGRLIAPKAIAWRDAMLIVTRAWPMTLWRHAEHYDTSSDKAGRRLASLLAWSGRSVRIAASALAAALICAVRYGTFETEETTKFASLISRLGPVVAGP